MSGIFGFSYRHAKPQVLSDALEGLEYWNRIYGRAASLHQSFDHSGIGCHVEHFSDQYPFGGPILMFQNHPAVVDALLYNRDELLPLLNLSADSCISDEELLLSLIEQKGIEILSVVNGDFAGAVYYEETSEWMLFRDHMGVRPLYYYLDEDLFAFSTDLRGLASLPCADLGINEPVLYKNLIGAFALSLTDTDYEHIHCLHPGSVTTFRMTGSGVERDEKIFWKFKQKKIRLASDEAYQAELRQLVTDAVNRRCDAISGLLGAELSGGLDSGVIDILISRHGREAAFFSWSLDPEVLPITDEGDERNIILEICKQEGIACHFTRREDMFDLRAKGEHLIPPRIDTIPISHGSRWIKSQGANVVFSGHGGDEGISHRPRRYELWLAGEYHAYFKMFREDLRGRPLRSLRAIRAGLQGVKLDQERIRRELSRDAENHEILQKDYCTRMVEVFQPTPFTFNYDPAFYVMQGGSRPRIDTAAYQGAVSGVRYLFPYLDYRVMDFALSIPRSQFLTPTQNRAVFRNAFRELMPDSLYNVKVKETISTKSIPDDPHRAERHQVKVTNLLNYLDQELWEKYIDFEALERVLRSHDGSSGGIGSVDSLIGYLVRCFRVQDVIKNAKNWREFDEQDKTV